MAKRKVRYRTRIKRVRSRAKGILSGKIGKAIKGGAVGFGINYVPDLPIVGKFTKPVILGGAGFFLKDNDLITMGAYELGRSMGSGGSGYIEGGFWEA